MAALRFLSADGTVVREHGLAHATTTIGRGLGNVVPIPSDRAASLRHAVIVRTPAGYLLRDAGSSNGTWVNQERVDERLLVDGDQVRFGGTLVVFTAAGPLPRRTG